MTSTRRSLTACVLLAATTVLLAGCGSTATTPSIKVVTDTVTVAGSNTAVVNTTTVSTAAASTSSTATATVPAAKPTVPTCDHTMWSVEPSSSEGAAGTIYIHFTIRNTAGFACRTRGYPGVALLGPSGRALPNQVTRMAPTNTLPNRAVAIPASGLAYFVVSYSDVDRAPGPCSAAAAVQVIPPNTVQPLVSQFASTAVADGIPSCSRQIQVSPVQLGSGTSTGQ